MNKEIFKLEELLKENGLPFFFNYREENRPAPFGAARVGLKDELLYIAIGPLTNSGSEAIVVNLGGLEEGKLLKVRLSDNNTNRCIDQLTAEAAFEIINDEFLKRRVEWWPEVYGTEK